MLTIQQKEELSALGYTRVPNAVDEASIAEVSDYLWQQLSEIGIHRNRPASWRQVKPKGIQAVSKTAVFDSVFKGVALECIDDVLGKGGWQSPKFWGQVLLSLPSDKEWSVPNTMWHLDLSPELANLSCPGVQLFVCVEDVVTKCGATVVAAGSHKLVDRWFRQHGLPAKKVSSSVRNQLQKKHEWFQQLWCSQRLTSYQEDEFKTPRIVEGVSLRVDELTGKRGDLILMHPYLFHSAAPNIGPALRLVLTQRVYSQESGSLSPR